MTHLTSTIYLSTFHNLLCALVLSAVVLSYHIFTQSPLQLWQFWNAAFVRSAWKERMRGTRPQRIAVPSALMQAPSICCWKPWCMPRRLWAPHEQPTTLKVTYSCVYVCVHVHVGILYLIRAYTTAPLSGIMSSKKRQNQRREVISLNHQSALHSLKHHSFQVYSWAAVNYELLCTLLVFLQVISCFLHVRPVIELSSYCITDTDEIKEKWEQLD